MHRFYISAEQLSGSRADLSPEDAHHARDVLRLEVGTPVELITEGSRYEARISEMAPQVVAVEIVNRLPSTEPRLAITLFQGLPKADKMEWIIQKAVELGVVRIVPVRMKRCVVRLSEQDGRKKAERWRRIAREACKQSGRSTLPQIDDPVSPDALPALIAGLDATAIPWESCAEGGPMAFARAHSSLSSLGIVIGPEGGMTPEEVELLRAAGGMPITLGPRILRTETAGLAAVSAFLGLYGEME